MDTVHEDEFTLDELVPVTKLKPKVDDVAAQLLGDVHPFTRLVAKYGFEAVYTRMKMHLEKEEVTCRPHPTLPLEVWKYSDRVHPAKFTAVLACCRGLVIDTERRCAAALPFPKFFNLGHEVSDLGLEARCFTEKADGSLIIAFYYGDEWHATTMGAMTSVQSHTAQPILPMESMRPECTYLFEGVFENSRVVVQYHDYKLVLLGAYETASGRWVPFHGKPMIFDADDVYAKFARPMVTYPVRSIGDMLTWMDTTYQPWELEGVVVYYDHGHRTKLKHPRYNMFHKLVTARSTPKLFKYALELLGKGVPREHLHIAKQTAIRRDLLDDVLHKLENDVRAIIEQLRAVLSSRPEWTAKELALLIKATGGGTAVKLSVKAKRAAVKAKKAKRAEGGGAAAAKGDGGAECATAAAVSDVADGAADAKDRGGAGTAVSDTTPALHPIVLRVLIPVWKERELDNMPALRQRIVRHLE